MGGPFSKTRSFVDMFCPINSNMFRFDIYRSIAVELFNWP